MTAQHPEIVIVRRRGSHEDEHHGGAWKIAFADFMTAMMAFFLVLWIISATDKNTKTLIARYFNPVKIEEPAKAQKGIRGAPVQDTDAPGRDSGVPNAEKSRSDQGETASGSVPETPEAPPKESRQKHQARPESMTPPDPAKPYPTMSEEELFSDPGASLDKIAGAPPPGPRVDPSAVLKGYGEVGPSADEAIRDPFRPLGSDKATDVAATGDKSEPKGEQPEPGPGGAGPQDLAKPDLSTQETSRPDVSKQESKAARLEAPATQTKSETPPAVEAKTANDSAQARAASLLTEVKKRLGPEAQSVPGPELDVQTTDEGILISLTDRQNFS